MEKIIREFMIDGRVSARSLLPLIYVNQKQVLQHLQRIAAQDKTYLLANIILIPRYKIKRRFAELCKALQSCGSDKIIPSLYEFCEKYRDENYSCAVESSQEAPNNRKRALFVYAKKCVRTAENRHKYRASASKIDNIL